ncbi:Cytoplasmic protein nck2 [Saguinus oedipus]|uniref:Cytoplasmic protein nck2 n=1 Tax=Saguinus oedipus TaxID=9490 RepID=A0ABQ9UM91_SAGOE|nr:Cytoplasmic protein nck2 [Saguinus oedipus]
MQHVVQTLYPFSSVTEEELNFEKGQTMEVIEKPENNPEWWKCKNVGARWASFPKTTWWSSVTGRPCTLRTPLR